MRIFFPSPVVCLYQNESACSLAQCNLITCSFDEVVEDGVVPTSQSTCSSHVGNISFETNCIIPSCSEPLLSSSQKPHTGSNQSGHSISSTSQEKIALSNSCLPSSHTIDSPQSCQSKSAQLNLVPKGNETSQNRTASQSQSQFDASESYSQTRSNGRGPKCSKKRHASTKDVVNLDNPGVLSKPSSPIPSSQRKDINSKRKGRKSKSNVNRKLPIPFFPT